MSESAGPAKGKRRARTIALLALGVLLVGPPLFVLYDYIRAFRLASGMAEGYALRGAQRQFTGTELRAVRRRHPLVGLTAYLPPREGPYAGYDHAVRVDVEWLWEPIAARFIGGPYVLKASATAAILPTQDGQWAALRVE